MKHIKMLCVAIAALFILTASVKAQASTTTTVGIDVLKARAALLKETINLNKLKILKCRGSRIGIQTEQSKRSIDQICCRK